MSLRHAAQGFTQLPALTVTTSDTEEQWRHAIGMVSSSPRRCLMNSLILNTSERASPLGPTDPNKGQLDPS